jgi:hypothetical protein
VSVKRECVCERERGEGEREGGRERKGEGRREGGREGGRERERERGREGREGGREEQCGTETGKGEARARIDNVTS